MTPQRAAKILFVMTMVFAGLFAGLMIVGSMFGSGAYAFVALALGVAVIGIVSIVGTAIALAIASFVQRSRDRKAEGSEGR